MQSAEMLWQSAHNAIATIQPDEWSRTHGTTGGNSVVPLTRRSLPSRSVDKMTPGTVCAPSVLVVSGCSVSVTMRGWPAEAELYSGLHSYKE